MLDPGASLAMGWVHAGDPRTSAVLGYLQDPMYHWGIAEVYIIWWYIWSNYNDLTATSLESWLICGESSPFMALFQVRIYYYLPRYIHFIKGTALPNWDLKLLGTYKTVEFTIENRNQTNHLMFFWPLIWWLGLKMAHRYGKNIPNGHITKMVEWIITDAIGTVKASSWKGATCVFFICMWSNPKMLVWCLY
jgi:hypothetical protein